jgi:hypothetical protein
VVGGVIILVLRHVFWRREPASAEA